MQAAIADSSFTGVLIRRQYVPGQRYVQLVFKTAGDTRLSISRNLRLVRSLVVGSTYRIEGPEYTVGDKTYIREPVAIPLEQKSKKTKKWLIILSAVLALLIGSGAAIAYAAQSANTNAPNTDTTATAETTTTPKVQSATTTQTAPAPTTTTPATTTTSQAVASTAGSCSTVTVPYISQTTPDSSLPAGTSKIVTAGKNGSKKICYPNGPNKPSTTTVVTAPVNQVMAIGTYVAPAQDNASTDITTPDTGQTTTSNAPADNVTPPPDDTLGQ